MRGKASATWRIPLFLSFLALLALSSCRAVEDRMSVSVTDEGSFTVEADTKLRWDTSAGFTAKERALRNQTEREFRQSSDRLTLRMRDSGALDVAVRAKEGSESGEPHITQISRRAHFKSTDQLNRFFAQETLTFHFSKNETLRSLEIFLPEPKMSFEETKALRSYEENFLPAALDLLDSLEALYHRLEKHPDRREAFRPLFEKSLDPVRLSPKRRKNFLGGEKDWLKRWQKRYSRLESVLDTDALTEVTLNKLSFLSHSIRLRIPADRPENLAGFRGEAKNNGSELLLRSHLPIEALLDLIEKYFSPNPMEFEKLGDRPLANVSFKAELPLRRDLEKELAESFAFTKYYRVSWRARSTAP